MISLLWLRLTKLFGWESCSALASVHTWLLTHHTRLLLAHHTWLSHHHSRLPHHLWLAHHSWLPHHLWLTHTRLHHTWLLHAGLNHSGLHHAWLLHTPGYHVLGVWVRCTFNKPVCLDDRLALLVCKTANRFQVLIQVDCIIVECLLYNTHRIFKSICFALKLDQFL